MKKLMLSFAVIAFTTLLLVSSCKKGNETLTTEEQLTTSQPSANRADVNSTRPGRVASFYEAYGPKAITYRISASEEAQIKLPAGGTIDIPAGAFAINGKAITSGEVEISVLDLPDRGSMALRGVNTMEGGNILVSNGNFNLQANVNGQPVDLELAQDITVSVPDRTKANIPVNLFTGGSNEARQFNWTPAQDPNGISPNSNMFTFNWPVITWCNIDWWWWPLTNSTTRSTSTTLQVDLPNNPGTIATYLGGTGNTVVLFVPKGYNTIVQLYDATSTGVSSISNSIPAGIKGRLLAYSITASGYYIATKDITTTSTSPMVESLTFTSTTAADLAAALSALSSY